MVILNHLNDMNRALFLKAALQSLPDETFLEKLEKHRGRGRNDYSIRVLWQFALLLIGWNVPSFTELKKGVSFVIRTPSSFSFSRFISLLSSYSEEFNQILSSLVEPQEIVAMGSFTMGEKKLNYLMNIETGLPFIWDDSNIHNSLEIELDRLLEKISFSKIKYLLAEASYEALSERLWNRYHIRPIIPLSHSSTEKFPYKDALYNDQGDVHCPGGPMFFSGFEESRQSLKFRCVAKHYGVHCDLYETCSLRKNIRIPLKINPQIFTPIPRFTHRWNKLWSMHTSKNLFEKIFLNRIPIDGKKEIFLRIASLLFAAAYRTKKLSNFSFN